MTTRLRRAGAFAAVAATATAAPALDRAAAVPFVLLAALALFGVKEGPIFELFARPADRREGQLNGLAGFALAAAGLAIFATIPQVPMPTGAFAAAVVVIGFGNLGKQLARESISHDFILTAAFVATGFAAATLGQIAVALQVGTPLDIPLFAFLAVVGALVAALLRAVLYERDDALVMLSVGFTLWLFTELATDVTAVGIAIALAVTVGLGYVSYALDTASVPGALTGVLLGLLTIVLGGYGWFGVLIAFYAIGGLASKYRYDEKAERGVAQENHGARGTGNVLANSAVALAAVVGVAATDQVSVSELVFVYAFAGGIATAMADTLSSEIGGIFDDPRLITTFQTVDPGTDGAITWQGEIAGIAGALLVAAIAAIGMPLGDAVAGAGIVVAGGVVGMTADSLLGALVEGDRIGNQAVNLLATVVGAVATVVFAVTLM